MSELTTVQTENSVKYLASITSVLPTSTTNLLKSYYLTKCRKLTLSGPVGLPQQFSKTTRRCPRCSVQFEDSLTSYKVEPMRKKNRFVRRLLIKNAKEERLTRFQSTFLKNMTLQGNINAHNKLVITCGTCKHETTEFLEKPKNVFRTESSTSLTKMQRNKKKKKRKDKFSGLNKAVVLSMTPQNRSSTNDFIPLKSAPVVNETIKKGQLPKKNLFTDKKQKSAINNKNMGSPQRLTFKAKKKQLKGLQDVLENAKQKQSPSVSLKQFLTSL